MRYNRWSKNTAKLKNQVGFTLIELLLVIITVGFVMTAIYGFLNYTNHSFDSVSDRSSSQSQFRLIMNDLGEEVGTAVGVKIVSKPIVSSSAIVAQVTDGMLTIKGCERDKSYPLTTGMTIAFSIRAGSKNVLHVQLTSQDGYSVESDLVAKNCTAIEGTTGDKLIITPIK